MAAMAGDLLVSLLLGRLYPGYSNLKMSVSALGNPSSPVRLFFNAWMLLEGILFLVSIPALHGRFAKTSAALAGATAVFVAAFAVGACVLTCFFSVGETKEVQTLASKIHGAGSAIGFTLFLFVPLLLALLCFKGGDNLLGAASAFCFVLSLACFALFVMSDKEAFAGTVISYEGLWQRLNLLFMYLPLALVALAK